jgi:uncharacterized protein (DUF1786 family)
LAILSGFGFIPFCETTCPRKVTSGVKPLTELTKKKNEFIWSDVCQEAFKKLKQAFMSPEDHGDFILDTDACDSSIGAVLSQMQDGRLRVIAYGSRTLNKAEKNYCITDKEL